MNDITLDKLQEAIGRIAKLQTLSIPAVSDGMPYVRLDEVADALSYVSDINVGELYQIVLRRKVKN